MGENKKKFKLFDMNRDGKGVKKEIEGPKNFKNFFKYLGRKFSKLLSVNLIMLLLVLPFIIALFVYLLGPTIDTMINPAYPVTYASAFLLENPAADLLLGVTSFQMPVPQPNSYVYYVIGAMALVYLLTFGWQNVGGAYLLRGLVRGDPVFVITDYFYAIKKNLRQGFMMGVIDCLLIFVLAIDFIFFADQQSSYLMDVMYITVIALMFIYIIMRFYIYLQIITFNLKLRKIIKNAFIFTALGIKRNLMALLGIAITVIINYYLYVFLQPFNIIVPLVLPLFYFMALSGFITTYAAYPVIERYMIDMAADGTSDDRDNSTPDGHDSNEIDN